jgi:hypothetical protein
MQVAREHFRTPVAAEFAQSYLARRGIDLVALRAFSGGESVVWYSVTVPVTNNAGRINGFVGPDVTGDD